MGRTLYWPFMDPCLRTYVETLGSSRSEMIDRFFAQFDSFPPVDRTELFGGRRSFHSASSFASAPSIATNGIRSFSIY